MAYNFRSVVNHILRKTEFAPVSETVDSQFTGPNIDPIVERIKDWTNEVYMDICNSGYWRFLETQASFETTPGQESYDLEPDCPVNSVISVRETSTPNLLKRIDFKQIDSISPDTSQNSQSVPQYYYFFNNKLFLYPVPAGTTNIVYRYYKQAQELAGPYDIPLIPEQWKWVWINGVLAKANQFLQDQSILDVRIQFENGLIQMRASNRADRQHHNSIKPS